jgi:hypothetical protein
MMETYFNTPPSLPDALVHIFLNAFVPLLSCLVYLGRFDFIFYPPAGGLMDKTHFTTCACTVIGRLIFLRGE